MGTRVRPKKPSTTSPPTPVKDEPVITPAAAPETLGSFGVKSIDQHDAIFLAASAAVKAKRGITVNPRFMKAVMGIETGNDGNYPVSRCRPCDGTDCVPACGPMQVKQQYHQWRCPECNFKTLGGQVELATHIIGMTMLEFGLDEYGALLKAYFNADDVNGTTQAAYVKKLRANVAAMEADAGVTPEEPTSPTKPASDQDALRAIIGKAVQRSPIFIFGGLNFDGNGQPLNYYKFGVGHGTLAANAHSGTDIFVDVGTPIYTPLAGTVRCVGKTGKPDWGQSCGAYEDVGGGPGNITVLTDAGLKITFGHMRKSLVKVGDRVEAGQQVGTSGDFNSPHLHLEVSIYAPDRVNKAIANYPNEPYFLLDPLPAIAEAMGGVATPVRPPKPIIYDLAKDYARFKITQAQASNILKKKYVNRNGLRPEVIVLHVQDGYTHGSLQHWTTVQASSTVMLQQDDSILNVIPAKDGPWTNGDVDAPDAKALALMNRFGRDLNPVTLSIEAEDGGTRKIDEGQKQSAIWQILNWWDDWTHLAGDLDRIVGHYQINSRAKANCGRYAPDILAALSDMQGGVPTPTYAEALPPPEWDGRDKIVNGITFYSLRRFYAARKDGVKALKYADPASVEVRAPLKKGEEFEGYYVVTGSDQKLWVVTRYGSRIQMSDLQPIFTITV